MAVGVEIRDVEHIFLEASNIKHQIFLLHYKITNYFPNVALILLALLLRSSFTQKITVVSALYKIIIICAL